MNVKKVWTTPDGDKLIAKLARVSNPANENNHETAPRLIKYLIDHKHWSPFEMVHACVEIEVPRDIGRQILRHRSFTFQELSGRYAAYNGLLDDREVRMQDTANRQHSIETDDVKLKAWWAEQLESLVAHSSSIYESALEKGVAKEVARVVLPEGLTPTRMYMCGSLRSWIHYWAIRCDAATQKEHRAVANATRTVILGDYPELRKVLENV